MTSHQLSHSHPAGNARGFEDHDHAACVNSALAVAEEKCTEESLRFTPVRRKVLELLLREHRALGAYAILDLLREAGFGAQPPVAYRALDFLTQHGFVHKIERLNAYLACSHPRQKHAPVFLICRLCDAIVETYPRQAEKAVNDVARAMGFQIERSAVEVEGICPNCLDKVAE